MDYDIHFYQRLPNYSAPETLKRSRTFQVVYTNHGIAYFYFSFLHK
ncbi:hypothetical protein K036_4279, partial [Acinetobacter baumannii 42057_5]